MKASSIVSNLDIRKNILNLSLNFLQVTEYYSMPAQYSGDDFVRCMIEGKIQLC